jgi:hypothetical protein
MRSQTQSKLDAMIFAKDALVSLVGKKAMEGQSWTKAVADHITKGQRALGPDSRNCPLCTKRAGVKADLSTAREIISGLAPRARRWLESEVLEPLHTDRVHAGVGSGIRLSSSLGVGATTSIGRRDAVNAILYAEEYTRLCPPPSRPAQMSGTWLVARFSNVFDGLANSDGIEEFSMIGRWMTHEAATDWLWGDVLVSRRMYRQLGNLPAVVISKLGFALFNAESDLPPSQPSSTLLVSRFALQQIVGGLARGLIEIAMSDERFKRIQGD